MDPATYFETPRLRVRGFARAHVGPFVAYRADPALGSEFLFAILEREWAART